METETKTKPPVKVWETDSTHKSFEKADTRRASLIEGGRDEDRVKIRQRARGFMVKVHNGQTRAAPEKAKSSNDR